MTNKANSRTPKYRGIFRFLGYCAWIVGVVGIVRLITYPAPTTLSLIGPDAKSLAEEFSDLTTRCRISIEQEAPLDTAGLERTEVPESWRRHRASEKTAWARHSSSPLVIVVHDREKPLCVVRFRDKTPLVSETDQALLIRAFLKDRQKLTLAGTHQNEELTLSEITIALGYSPKESSSSGCGIMNALFVDVNGDSLRFLSGVQGWPHCGR